MVLSVFEDIEERIINRINSSKHIVFVAVAWFTNQLLLDSVVVALKRNVVVKVLILDDILNRNEFGLDFGILTKLGAEVCFAKSSNGTMHNKFCIIDDIVITGSYNWTYHANKNRENILMTDEKSVVEGYREEFTKLFNDAIPIPQPYEYMKWTDVKEGDFFELRRNIFRDVIARNDENSELRRIKLINLNHAYKSGDTEELAKVSSFAIRKPLRTITDVLTSRSQDYTYRLWKENFVGKAFDNVSGYIQWEKWFFIPYEIKENKNHQLYLEGFLNVYSDLDVTCYCGLNLIIYDEAFIKVVSSLWGGKLKGDYELIPIEILTIEWAKMVYYSFPTPMYNRSQPRMQYNKPRLVPGINIFSIAKQVEGGNVTFYEGWNPQNRGEKIMKEFFEKEL